MYRENLRRALLSVFVAAVLTACGDGDSGKFSATPLVPGAPSTVVANPTSSTTPTTPATPATPATPTTPATPATPVSAAETEADIFARVAPKDKVFEDSNTYDTTADGTIALSSITEDTSVMQHTITMDGQKLPYVARSGHLITYNAAASAATTSTSSTAGSAKQPDAAIFYTSYTRDALPAENRPVTFLWNGGPGSASIWLHMGSWGPMRLKSDAPTMKDETVQPTSFPFEDNAISLLDQSDIVFVDPPGTGLSVAISPLKNQDLWGTDVDARVVAEFITSYINKYRRQSSPKYLYGESYGGIRTPIVANLLEQAGTSNYAPDPSGKKAKVLAGFILNSPLVNYNSNCDMSRGTASCEGYIPSYAMAADYFKKSLKRGDKDQGKYLDELRTLARESYGKTQAAYFSPTKFSSPLDKNKWNSFTASPEGKAILEKIEAYTGISATTWKNTFNYGPGSFRSALVPGSTLGRYDARMKVPNGNKFAADDYINVAFLNQVKDYFPKFTNYKNKSAYQPLNGDTIAYWDWARKGSNTYYPESITDIQAVLTANPESKLLILHGYEDVATPGFQTELDLEGVNLASRIPVKWFEGGHMIYNTEASRAPLKKVLIDYYSSPAQSAMAVQSAKFVDAAVFQ